MSEKEKEKEKENEQKKEQNNSTDKNNNNINTIDFFHESNKDENNLIANKDFTNLLDNSPHSYTTPKSSYGSFPSPFSSESPKSESNYSNSKKSYHRSRSRSLLKSKSKSKSRSKSYKSHSKSNNSNKSYHNDRPRNIPQVFITRLSHYVTKRDLEKEFRRFGDIRNSTLKKGYGFIEYYDKKDAKYAIRALNGRKLFGQSNRVVVEEAKVSREERERERRRSRRSRSKEREKENEDSKEKEKDRDYYYKRKSGPKKTDVCYNCGKEGHWANECHEIKRRR